MQKIQLILRRLITTVLLGYFLNGLPCRVAALKDATPYISEHPMDSIVPKNNPFTFNCKAEGNPAPTIKWYKDGHEVRLESGTHRLVLPTGALFFLKVMHTRRESDAGVYWCEAHNEFGSARSHNATLQVAFLRDEFRLEPQSMRVPQGGLALLECGAPRGSPEPQISWRKNGQILSLEHHKRIRIIDGGNLVIEDVRQTDDGRYQCVVKNIVGARESRVAMLKVHARPFLIKGPENQTALVGSSVVFSCRIGGDPLPDVLWRRTASGGNMPLLRVQVLEDRSLQLNDITLEDMGEYICQADNDVGSITATGTLIVQASPKFIIRPKNHLVEIDEEVAFECQASGYPQPTLYWSIESNSTLFFTGYDDGQISVSTTDAGVSLLKIRRFARQDSGEVIICNALNTVGSISSRIVVTVNTEDELPPPIIEQGPLNQTLPMNSLVILPCRATGTPVPDISWYLNGMPIDEYDRRNFSEDGSLIIDELLRVEDEGLYTCIARNRYGKSSWSGYLRIEPAASPNVQFYRAEPAKCPAAPGRPELVEKTDQSITLNWAAAADVGASNLLGYVVEFYGWNRTEGWTVVAKQLQQTKYTQMELVSGVQYYFIVRAENAHCISPPSPISEPISVSKRYMNSGLEISEARASLLSGDIVELNNVSAIDSTSMKLSWKVINSNYIEGFYIYARKLPKVLGNATVAIEDSIKYEMLTVLNAGVSTTCTMSGLLPYSLYEFFMVPFYKSVEGNPSNSRIARTLEYAPNAMPYDMDAALFNASAVFLRWKAPKMKAENGLLLYYHVIVRGIDPEYNFSRILTNVTIDSASPTLVLANLTEGIVYSVAVAAGNNAGIGPYSQPIAMCLDPETKRLEVYNNDRYLLHHDNADDIITQPWFIILLGAILAVMMTSFGAMVCMKRKHMTMKQSALSNVRGSHAMSSTKAQRLQGNSSYWLDTSTGALTWRTTPTGDALDRPNAQSEKYAPVCGGIYNGSTADMGPNQNGLAVVSNQAQIHANYNSEYYNMPSDRGHVNSFGKLLQCNETVSPYATSEMLNTTQHPQYALGQLYASEHGCGDHRQQQQQQHQQTRSYLDDSRSVYSEQQYWPENGINMSENRLDQLPQPVRRQLSERRTGSFRITPSKRLQPELEQQLIAVGSNGNNSATNNNNSHSTTELLAKDLLDLDNASICYQGLTDSGCGGSPSPRDEEQRKLNKRPVDEFEYAYAQVEEPGGYYRPRQEQQQQQQQ